MVFILVKYEFHLIIIALALYMNVAKKKMAEMPRRKGGTGKKTKKVEVLTQHLTINPWLVSYVYPQFGYIACFASCQRYTLEYNEWLTVVQYPWHLQ